MASSSRSVATGLSVDNHSRVPEGSLSESRGPTVKSAPDSASLARRMYYFAGFNETGPQPMDSESTFMFRPSLELKTLVQNALVAEQIYHDWECSSASDSVEYGENKRREVESDSDGGDSCLGESYVEVSSPESPSSDGVGESSPISSDRSELETALANLQVGQARVEEYLNELEELEVSEEKKAKSKNVIESQL